jgi:hypothetical protein
MIVANPANLAAISLLAHAQARSGKVDAAVATLRAATQARPGDTRELQQQRRRLVDDLAGVSPMHCATTRPSPPTKINSRRAA